MKKKIINVVLMIALIFFASNSIFAYISYDRVTKGDEPLFYLDKKKNDSYVLYNELLYNIKITNNGGNKVTTLKLFFIK